MNKANSLYYIAFLLFFILILNWTAGKKSVYQFLLILLASILLTSWKEIEKLREGGK